MSNVTKSSRWLIASALFLITTLMGLFLYEGDQVEDFEEEALLLPVSITTLMPKTKQLTVNTTGVTQARWVTNLVAAVEGRAEVLEAGLEPGILVEREQVILRQQDSAYQAAVDAANSRLAEAQLNLKRTLHQQTVAKNSKAILHTPYARFEPQVKSAQDSVKAAKSALINAQQHLSDTQIRAPFPAIILERQVTPGQWLQAGQQLFLLADKNSIDVRVELSDNDWNQLASTEIDSAADITTSEGETWQGSIRYIAPTRDKSTRQRSLILKVENPYVALSERKRLLPDTQVNVQFSGKSEAQVFILPASTLTEDGDVWTLNTEAQLQLEKVQLFSQTAEEIVVRFKQNSDNERRVVLYPLGSMIQGQQVEAVEGQQ